MFLHQLIQALSHPLDTLYSHKDKWGSQYFVELALFFNLAVFEVEQLAKYGRFVKSWAVGAAAATKLNALDDDDKKAAARMIGKALATASKYHNFVWSFFKWAAYVSVIWSAGILFLDRPSCAYYIFLLTPSVGYLLCVGIAMVLLWIFCVSIRKFLMVKVPENPDGEIRKILGNLPH